MISESGKSEVSSKLSRAENEIKLLRTQVGNLKRLSEEIEEKSSVEVELFRRDLDAFKLRDREAC